MQSQPGAAPAGTTTIVLILPSRPTATALPEACPDPNAIPTMVPGWNPEPVTLSSVPGAADHWLTVGMGTDAGLIGAAV